MLMQKAMEVSFHVPLVSINVSIEFYPSSVAHGHAKPVISPQHVSTF